MIVWRFAVNLFFLPKGLNVQKIVSWLSAKSGGYIWPQSAMYTAVGGVYILYILLRIVSMTNKTYGRFEKDIAETFSLAITEPSPAIDTFSTWLLGGTAAAVALLLSNIDKLVPRLGAVPSKLILLVLGISVIFGLLQKFSALQLHMGQKISEAAETKLAKLVTMHAGKEVADPYSYIRENANAVDAIVLMVSSFPRALRNKFVSQYFRNSSDPVEWNRSQVTLLVKQMAYLTAQAVFVIIAIPIASYGI